MTVRTVPTGPIRPKSAAPGPSWAKTCASGLVVRTSFDVPDAPGARVGATAAGVVVRVGVVTTGVGAGGPATGSMSVRLTQP